MPRHPLASVVLLAASLILAARLAPPALAQDAPPRAPGAPDAVTERVFAGDATTVPWFDLGDSPLALRGPARAGQYLSSVGRRALAMSTEQGSLELWTWPFKWLHDLELSFRIPKSTVAVPGRLLATSVVQRPEGLTIEYTHEQFTVREHVFVPLDEPAAIVLLEVDALRPLEIVVGFSPDIHPAWPAGLGGQYLIWEQAARAFLFSEGRQEVNAFMGSPAVLRASDVPAHMLAAERPQLVLGVGDADQRYAPPRLAEPPGRAVDLHVAYVPIVLAGGAMPRDDALALYRRLSEPGAAEREWRRRVAHADALREEGFSLRSPDALLDRAVEWAKVDLDALLACNPDLGCGLVAGYGMSGGASDRPGFGWFFGGDGAINALAMTGVGQADLVAEGLLRFFASFQREDGKIAHEISQGAGRVDWFGYPYAYWHGDTTPYWILAAGEWWRQTGDDEALRALWPALVRAFEWSRATDRDGDGLMENPAAGAGALEVGDLQIGILSDVYLAGVWVSALERFARMADALGDDALAEEARAIRRTASATLEGRLWLEERGQYAFALLQDGSVNDALTAWPATALAFGALDARRGARMAERLASSAIMTDWGARPLAATSALFDPLHYNNGAVWPFVTGFVSLAQYRVHDAPAGWFALRAVARTGTDFALGHNPELLSGRLYKPLEAAVPQQGFATSMVVTPLLRGLLGLDVDLPARRVTIAPHLPPDWDGVTAERVPVGDGTLTVVLERSDGHMSARVTRSGDATPLEVVFSPALPLGARVAGDGVEVEQTPGDVHATVRATLVDAAELSVAWSGGWSVVPPATAPRVGDRSHAPRVLSERLDASGRYVLVLEAPAGSTHGFTVRAPDAARARTLACVVSGEARALVDAPASGDGRERVVRVTFPADGASADGFTATALAVVAR